MYIFETRHCLRGSTINFSAQLSEVREHIWQGSTPMHHSLLLPSGGANPDIHVYIPMLCMTKAEPTSMAVTLAKFHTVQVESRQIKGFKNLASIVSSFSVHSLFLAQQCKQTILLFSPLSLTFYSRTNLAAAPLLHSGIGGRGVGQGERIPPHFSERGTLPPTFQDR